MPAPEEISKLVERYTNNRKQYISSSYREADVRLEFLDPLFKALDWDVDNTQGNAPQYRDVVTEESLEVEGSIKTPDYSFRLSGTTKFFVEAKKPSVDITSDKMPAFQLKRYAWSAKLPLSILTNFEDISVYDCRYKPVKTDDPTKGRILYIPFTDLVERWDELVEIFTKDAILKGSFDKYAQAKKRGTSEVDAEILKEIEGWREELAKNIAKNNEFTTEQVNFTVQRLIDRILFLRICEDRKTEPENQLLKIYESKRDIYKHLMDVFQLADTKYNSGLFHFLHDKKRTTKRDTVSPYMKVDDKVLASIIYDLYYPNSPYQFDVIPADILGQVYEQFLGKVIKLSASGKTAKIEEKPEVKKAGGVYYTPTYIVEYIVDNTVSKLCEGKNLDELAKIKILDPACGSGSFLIVAYKKMLDKHLEWYMTNNPKKHNDQIFLKRKDEWQLTLQEKKRILLNNIHGVDIDGQAVEVTKLNLLLKALEGESKESIGNVRKWFREPALPDLGSNIKCGNSLIDFDIIDHLQDLSDDERDNELERINPFSWQEEFTEIMKTGGFDAVIGNPPYIRIQTMKEWAPIEVEHYKTVYKTAKHGNYDIYVVFVEKGLQLLNIKGKLGYILPHKFFSAKYGVGLRKIIAEGKAIYEIVDFTTNQIFENAATYTCLLFLTGTKQTELNYKKIALNEDVEKELLSDSYDNLPSDLIVEGAWNFPSHKSQRILSKLQGFPYTLGDATRKIYKGSSTGNDKIYLLKLINRSDQITTCYSSILNKEIDIENNLLKPFLHGCDIKRYMVPETKLLLLFPYEYANGTCKLISSDKMKLQYPLGYDYLVQFKESLLKRKIKFSGNDFYKYSAARSLKEYPQQKILVPDVLVENRIAVDEEGAFYHGPAMHGLLFEGKALSHNKLYFLGILNSKIFWFFVKNTSTALRGDAFRLTPMYIAPFPIKMVDLNNSSEIKQHDKMVKLVERMLKLHKDVKEASTPDAETRVQRQIEATDRKIDGLVYELYGLSEEEVRIVEGEA